MRRKLKSAIVVITVSCALFWSIASIGQVIRGSISGTVTDPQGAVISGAKVKVTNSATGAVFNTTSDSAGSFKFSLIPAGSYKLEASATGFKTTVQSDINVAAGGDAGLGLVKLVVGEASTTVEVTAAAPLVESTQAQVTNTFTGTELKTFVGVQENQGLDSMATFVPGVSSSRDNNFSNTNGGNGFAVNGLRGRNNDQQIDGQNNNDNSVAGPALLLSDAEFVQQYVLVTNQFGPEYGRNAGSVVNVITKSGTNNWHGSLYGSENNSVLNTMTNFQKRFQGLSEVPRANDEFGGGTIGGPWVKNKFFIFGGFSQEIISQKSDFSSTLLTPTPNGIATLSSCFPASASVQALSKFGPYSISAGNPTPVGPLVNQMITGCPSLVEFGGVNRIAPTPTHIFNWLMRADLQMGSDILSGRYVFGRLNVFNNEINSGDGAAGQLVNVPALSQAVLLSWTHNFSSRLVNEARGGFDRVNVQFGGNNLSNPSLPGDNQLANTVTHVQFLDPTLLQFGPPNGFPQGRIVNTWQGQDNLSYVLGRHQLKIGVNYTYQRSPNIFLPNINGTFRFDDWSAFAANTPDRVRIAQGNPSLDFREHDTFAYIGDDLKLGKSLTLNLGVTWSYYGQPANIFNKLTVQNQTGPNPLFNPALPLSATTFPKLPSVTNSWGPSFGFAYDPGGGGMFTGNGKTVIRGGYRFLYDPPYYNIYTNIANSAPNVFLQTFSPAQSATLPLPAVPTGPNVRASLAPFTTPGVFDPRTLNETTVSPNFGPDRVQTWSLGIEREVSKNSAVEIRYIGNHATALFQSINGNPDITTLAGQFPNLVPPGVTPCTTPQLVLGPGQTVNPALGRENCSQGILLTRNNGGFSNYQSLQAEFRANNLFKQLTIRAAYTYSKTLDNVSEIFSTLAGGNSLAFAQNPLNPAGAEYSYSGLDYPHQGSISFSEQFPLYREQHGFIGHR